MVLQKQCKRCRTVKPIEDFYANTRNADALDGMCKVCKRAAVTAWRNENLEDRREYDRQKQRRYQAEGKGKRDRTRRAKNAN